MLDDGYVVYPWDSVGMQRCRIMRELNLIDTLCRELVDCANSNDYDYETLSTEEKRCTGHLILDSESVARGWKQCPNCGRMVHLDEKSERRQTWLIKHRPIQIRNYVEDMCEPFVDEMHKTHDGFAWHVSKGEFSGLLVLLEYMPLEVTRRILSDSMSGFTGIVVGDHLFKSVSKTHMTLNLVPFMKIIEDESSLESAIVGAMTHLPERLQVEECRRALEQHVATMGKSGGEFERFCLDFEGDVLGSTNRKRKFLASLWTNRNLMYRTIRLGGSGLPDLIRLPLHKYISDFFTSVASIESKQYVNSKLTTDKFGRAVVHSRRYPGSKLIVYVSSTAVAPSIWDDVFRIRGTDGGFQYLIIDSLMMAYLILGLGLEHLLE